MKKFKTLCVCAVVLWALAAGAASASFVQAVRPGQEGEGWVTLLGDLVTPENQAGPAGRSFLTSKNVGKINWEQQNFGPVLADLRFSKNVPSDLSALSLKAAEDLSPWSFPSSAEAGGGFSGGQNAHQPFDLFSGKISGILSVAESLDITVSGTLEAVPQVPLPGTVWLFLTGLAGAVWLMRRRLRAGRLGG